MKKKWIVNGIVTMLLALLIIISAGAVGINQEILGEWELHWYNTTQTTYTGDSFYHVLLLVREDGSARITERVYNAAEEYETHIQEGTWRFENNAYFFRFTDYEELKLTLNNGILQSKGYRGREMLFIKPYDKAEQKFGVSVNAYHFPDRQFRQEIIRIVLGKDNAYAADRITLMETKKSTLEKLVKELDLSGKQIFSLKGIEYLKQLRILKCDNNILTELDLSGLEKLTEVHVTNNQITSINLTGCKSLKKLYCGGNRLISLNLSDCPNLEVLKCEGNSLTALELSECTMLKELDCSGNQIIALNLENNKSLTAVNAGQMTSLTEIVLGKKGSLKTLLLQHTNLSVLDVSGCPIISKWILTQKYNSLPSPLIITDRNGSFEADGDETIKVSEKVTLTP